MWRMMRPLWRWAGCDFGDATFLHYRVGQGLISICYDGNDFTIYHGPSKTSVADDADAFALTLRNLILNNQCSGRTEFNMEENPEYFANQCLLVSLRVAVPFYVAWG